MKKKIVAAALILFAVLALAIHYQSGGHTWRTERIIGKSEMYTNREIDAAMDVVEAFFRKEFHDCILTRLEYSESTTYSQYVWMSRQYENERTIVLVSDFYVGANAHPSFNLESTYSNWQWILTEEEGEGWVLQTWGYG